MSFLTQQFYYLAALTISSCAFCLTVVTLALTLKRDRLKKGVHIRGTFSVMSDKSCEDKYVGNVFLENLKDRAATILAIHLKFGNNIYLEIENFDESPLILEPFKTFHKKYGPLLLYLSNEYRVNLNELFEDRKIKRRLVLTTSEGKYEVGEFIPLWNPILEFFNNHLTDVINPVRTTYKDHDIGSNVSFILEMKFASGHEEITPLHPGDYRLKLFRNFQLTKESLESKRALEDYLNSLISQGIIKCESFEVIDPKIWQEERFKLGELKKRDAKPFGKFTYYVVGNFITIWDDWQMKRRNKKLASEYRKKSEDASKEREKKPKASNRK